MTGESALLQEKPADPAVGTPVAEVPQDVQLDLARVVADTHALRASFNRMDPNKGAVINDLNSNYLNMWSAQPAKAAGLTAATTLVGVGMFSKLPRVTAYGAGIYGATKLVLTDGHDLLAARNSEDVLKYGASSLSDVTMMAGVAARYIPHLKKASMAITAAGVIGRVGSSFLPDSNDYVDEKVTAPLSQRVSVDVPIAGGKTEKREFDVFIPKSAGDRELPLMLVMHGVADGNAAGIMENETAMNRLAEEKQFAVAYPIAKSQPYMGNTIQDWNSPGAGLTPPQAGYDDVDYIKALINKVGTMTNVDQSALYATGFSSGGAFAQHLRGRMPGTFAGVASIHGTLLGTEARPVAGDQTAFISVHSSSDQMLPYGGGRGLMTVILPRVADSNPRSQIPLALRGNGMSDAQAMRGSFRGVEVTEYATQPGQAPVKEYMVQGGWQGGPLAAIFGRGRDGFPANHAWDGPGTGGWPVVGEKNRAFDVSRLVVEELLRYKKPGDLKIARDLR